MYCSVLGKLRRAVPDAKRKFEQCASLYCPQHVKMVSVSFDEYQSIFEETIRKDQIVTPTCFVETKGEYSGLFKKYRLGRGFTNYLLDDNGVIIAKTSLLQNFPLT